MKRIIFLPPNYFYGCILFCIPFYFIMDKLTLITFPYNLSGIIFVLLGIYLILAPYYLFRKHDTPENFDESKALVTEGLYRLSRNPMYVGKIIFLTGLAMTTGNLLALASPVVFFFVMHVMFIPFEEEKMEKTFGKDYMNYKQTVRRWI